MNRRQLISACLLAFALAATSAGVGATAWNRAEYVQFREAVALPGVTLAPGVYRFELADINNPSLVMVRDRDTRNPRFIGFTHRVARPAGSSRGKSAVVLGEGRRGDAPPVRAWFPIDQETGYEFIYRAAR